MFKFVRVLRDIMEVDKNNDRIFFHEMPLKKWRKEVKMNMNVLFMGISLNLIYGA